MHKRIRLAVDGVRIMRGKRHRALQRRETFLDIAEIKLGDAKLAMAGSEDKAPAPESGETTEAAAIVRRPVRRPSG